MMSPIVSKLELIKMSNAIIAYNTVMLYVQGSMHWNEEHYSSQLNCHCSICEKKHLKITNTIIVHYAVILYLKKKTLF